MGGHSCPLKGSYIRKGYTMVKEWKDLPTAKQYAVGDYVQVALSEDEHYVVQVLSVHDGHYDVIEYSAEEMMGELYMDQDNHRLIGR
jgi:hypothetical protein